MNFTGALGEALTLSKDILDKTKGGFYDKSSAIFQINEQKFITSVGKYLGKMYPDKPFEIHLVRHEAEDDSVYGLYTKEVTEKLVIIYIVVNTKKSICWQRFTICKEMIHPYLEFDNTNDPFTVYNTEDILRQIKETNEAQRNLSLGNNVDFPQGFNSEALAYIIACDLFFKVDYKSILCDIQEEIENKTSEFSYHDLADIFKCPEKNATILYMEKIGSQSCAFHTKQ
jgi:hypothetical protein